MADTLTIPCPHSTNRCLGRHTQYLQCKTAMHPVNTRNQVKLRPQGHPTNQGGLPPNYFGKVVKYRNNESVHLVPALLVFLFVMAEGRPSSPQEEGHGGANRRRRSPNLGIATIALDAIGNSLGIEALGSSLSPAEPALALFATRKILIRTHLIISHESKNPCYTYFIYVP